MSTWQELTRGLIHRIEQETLAVLDGLDPVLLDVVVEPGANSIGWLLWHLTRSHDRNVSEIRGAEQLWTTDGWHARFNRTADPCDTGYQHTSNQAAAFRSPHVDVFCGYHHAVVQMIDCYLDTAAADDLGRLALSPTLDITLPVQHRLTGVINEGLQHVGQAAMIRGILQHRLSNAAEHGG